MQKEFTAIIVDVDVRIVVESFVCIEIAFGLD